MMRVVQAPSAVELAEALQRPAALEEGLDEKVRSVLADVRQRGDQAVRAYSERFDKKKVAVFEVSKAEMEAAEVAPELEAAMRVAKRNIEAFHSAQLTPEIRVETMPGVVCRQRSVAIDRVGLYIPGGTAPLFSTVLMLAVPARIAGCGQIVLCTPPDPAPAILVAARLCGIDRVFRIGGVQAIGAMAYGTESVPKVDKIFGPGNSYVMKAKQLCGVAIDMPAGPSEVMVLADGAANAAFVAADLLSQAEHGVDSQSILVTDSQDLAQKVLAEVAQQLERLPRQDTARQSLASSRIIIVNSVADMIDAANAYAAEHLIIQTVDAHGVSEQIRNAGSVFIGPYTPESAGDYASGTNHTLPTSGWAASFGGVTTESFCKRITYQEITREGLEALSPTIQIMARAEGLEAHATAAEIRTKY